jgi:hypothetical protein
MGPEGYHFLHLQRWDLQSGTNILRQNVFQVQQSRVGKFQVLQQIWVAGT